MGSESTLYLKKRLTPMKTERTHLLTLLYSLFFLLYSWYIAIHPASFGHNKGDDIWYYCKFLLIAGYCFFIFQGLLLRSRNWGILLLLPLAILLITILLVLSLVGLLHLGGGGGTLLNSDKADIISASLLSLACTVFALRYIK